jgi:lipopolysaccharide transport system ATP-binding protein
MRDDVLVKVDNVSKRFCRSLKRSLWYGLQDLGSEIGGRRHGGGSGLPQSSVDVQLRPDEFWAVKDVSFELRRGECLGLIGRNGAGKTTLLRMLNGLVRTDSGSITMRGRAGAMIALGAGFNPVLTGRENIYINASVLGMVRQETDKTIEEIIAFSEIGSFIDAPVQNYSSGMQVRLGFAIATAIKPDILVLDEILAVGDADFRYKCYNKIAEIKNQAAVILVSHNMEQVGRTCERCILLDKGKISLNSDTANAIEEYERINHCSTQQDASFIKFEHPLREFSLFITEEWVHFGDPIQINLRLVSVEEIEGCMVKTIFYTPYNTWAAESHLLMDETQLKICKGENILSWRIQSIPLKAGIYKIGVILIARGGMFLGWSYKMNHILVQGASSGYHAECILRSIPLPETK